MPHNPRPDTEKVTAHFGEIWPVHLTAFSRLLLQLRRAFDGDLDLLVILAAIAERTPTSSWEKKVDNVQEILRAPGPGPNQRPINVQSLSDYTGVPRETVRRKIAILESRGWVTRKGDGSIAVERKAAIDLESATTHSIEYIASILAAYEAAVAKKS